MALCRKEVHMSSVLELTIEKQQELASCRNMSLTQWQNHVKQILEESKKYQDQVTSVHQNPERFKRFVEGLD